MTLKKDYQRVEWLNMFSLLIAALVFIGPACCLGSENGEFRGKAYDGIDSYERNIDEKDLRVLGRTLSKSLLREEQGKISSGFIVESGGTGPDDNAQICYVGNSGALLLQYKFQFDPDIRFLHTAILLKDKKAKDIYGKCIPNPKITNELTIAGGIHLGMSQVEMKKIWGKPSKIVPGILIYILRRPTDEYFTDDVMIYAEFTNDKLTYVEVTRASIH